MSRFQFLTTPLEGLFVVKRKPLTDSRGFFSRIFCAEEFREAGLMQTIAQINQTRTDKKGFVRGLHFQYAPHAEAKLIACMQGEVWDVAVDIREGSDTFMKWYAVILSEENNIGLYVPEGFAHGFQTMTNHCQLIYLHSASYQPKAEGGIHPSDKRILIDWPLKIKGMSQKDRDRSMLDSNFCGINIR